MVNSTDPKIYMDRLRRKELWPNLETRNQLGIKYLLLEMKTYDMKEQVADQVPNAWDYWE